MGPYSHLVLAAKLEKNLKPEDPAEYYWGSVVPDIRYLANMRRERTHLHQHKFSELYSQYPHLKSFLLGYQVHCLIDESDFIRIIYDAFPLNLIQGVLQRTIPSMQMTMLVEVYHLPKRITPATLSGSHNEFLSDLGITPEQTKCYAGTMQEYIALHSLEAIFSVYQKIGAVDNTRLEKYMNACHSLKNKRLKTALSMLSIGVSGLDHKVIKYVRSNIDPLIPDRLIS